MMHEYLSLVLAGRLIFAHTYPDRVDSGPFVIGEIDDDNSMSAVYAAFQDWQILRIRINNPSPFFIEDPYCFATGPGTGMHYSINTYWADSQGTFSLGPENCSPVSTGMHFDPTIACGPESANPHCICVPPSSANSLASGAYICDPGQYQAEPYTCEVGDLSGKYGVLNFNMSNRMVTLPPRFVPIDPSALVATPCPRAYANAVVPAAVVAVDEPVAEAPVQPPPLTHDSTLADLLRSALGEVMTEGLGALAPTPVTSALPATAFFTPHDRPLRQSVQLTNGYNLIFRIIRDPRGPPVSMLRGKSLVFSCAGPARARVACMKLSYADGVRFEQARNEVLVRLAHHNKYFDLHHHHKSHEQVEDRETSSLRGTESSARWPLATTLMDTLNELFTTKFIMPLGAGQ